MKKPHGCCAACWPPEHADFRGGSLRRSALPSSPAAPHAPKKFGDTLQPAYSTACSNSRRAVVRPYPARFKQRLTLLLNTPAPQPESPSKSDSVASSPPSLLHGAVPAAFPIVLVNRES